MEAGQAAWESLEVDPRPEVQSAWAGAVLLSDEIEYYCGHPEYPLIQPFEKDKLKPARYQLTLGSEAIIAGRLRTIDENNPLIIPPHQVAIVRTYEKLNIPRFMIGRWNLTVDNVYKGLLWVGALQVDPGWVGYLPCPLYNMSNEEVQITFREKLFTIDFVRTTQFREGCMPYKRKDFRPNPPLKDFDRHHLRSGPYETLRKLDELLDFRNLMVMAMTILVAVLAVIVGVVAIRPTAEVDGILLTGWPMAALLSLVMSGLALIFSLLSLKRSRRR